MSARMNASHAIAAMMAFGAAVILALAACAPSLPRGMRECVGFPAEVCQTQVADLEQEGMSHGGVTAYRLVCSTGSCTSEGGEGRVTVVFGDGTGREGSFGYATPAGTPPDAPSATEPPLTVTPACLDVPEPWCERAAQAAASEAVASEAVSGGKTVVSITVRCTTTCTETTGDAEMRVTLSDGTVLTSSYGYRS
jgi:hypothetical protein